MRHTTVLTVAAMLGLPLLCSCPDLAAPAKFGFTTAIYERVGWRVERKFDFEAGMRAFWLTRVLLGGAYGEDGKRRPCRMLLVKHDRVVYDTAEGAGADEWEAGKFLQTMHDGQWRMEKPGIETRTDERVLLVEGPIPSPDGNGPDRHRVVVIAARAGNPVPVARVDSFDRVEAGARGTIIIRASGSALPARPGRTGTAPPMPGWLPEAIFALPQGGSGVFYSAPGAFPADKPPPGTAGATRHRLILRDATGATLDSDVFLAGLFKGEPPPMLLDATLFVTKDGTVLLQGAVPPVSGAWPRFLFVALARGSGGFAPRTLAIADAGVALQTDGAVTVSY